MANGTRGCPELPAIKCRRSQEATSNGMPGRSIGSTATWRYRVPQWCTSRPACSPSCPLGCPYCSTPLALDAREDELDTATWVRVFGEAAALGVLQVHLSGGEPGARRDLVDITAGAHAAGLYTNLITSAVGITDKTLGALAGAGLDHVQISIQD